MKAETKKNVKEAIIIGGTFVASAGVGYLAGTAVIKMVEAGWTGLKLVGGIAATAAGTCVACDGIAAVATDALNKAEDQYIIDRTHELIKEADAALASSKAPKKGIWANGPKKSNAHLYV